MTYSPAFDTVEAREVTWLGVDPPPGWNAAPPLLKTSAGPFDAVQAFFWESAGLPDQRAIYINRLRTVTLPMEWGMPNAYAWRHELELTVTWTFETASGKLEDEQQALLTAVAALEQRIRGPQGDKTHGQQFLAVAVGDARDQIVSNVNANEVRAAYEAGQTFETRILYPVYDQIFS